MEDSSRNEDASAHNGGSSSSSSHDTKRINFELKFSSSKGEFPINVDFVAVLEKRRVPLAYYVAQEALITTTDQAAVEQLSKVLLGCPLSFAGETLLGLLVQANDSRWIIYGRKNKAKAAASTNEGGDAESVEPETLLVVARMLAEPSFKGFVRPEVQDGQSAFLVKKVRSALDDHQVKRRKKRRLSPAASDALVADSADTQQRTETLAKTDTQQDETRHVECTQTRGRGEEGTASSMGKHAIDKVTISAETSGTALADKSLKDKLKKMIITLLSLQGISKKCSSFKELYQHTLQAASFALRHVSTEDTSRWEAEAMEINQKLLRIFMGPAHKDV